MINELHAKIAKQKEEITKLKDERREILRAQYNNNTKVMFTKYTNYIPIRLSMTESNSRPRTKG